MGVMLRRGRDRHDGVVGLGLQRTAVALQGRSIYLTRLNVLGKPRRCRRKS